MRDAATMVMVEEWMKLCQPRMVLTIQTSFTDSASQVDERGTEVQSATQKRLQTSGASIARTILTTLKIATKGTHDTTKSPTRIQEQKLKNDLCSHSFVFTFKGQEVMSFLIYFWIPALQAIIIIKGALSHYLATL